MKQKVRGTFEVKLTPQVKPDALIRLMAIEKTYHGHLLARSHGEMLSVHGGLENSAGYVAMEWVVGMLDGRHGAFALQHSGTMNRGVPSLSVSVVPDSGSAAMAGLTGTMEIEIVEGKHYYIFDYLIPEDD